MIWINAQWGKIMKTETLRQKQSRFARMVVRLLLHAELLGYEYTFGETERHQDAEHGHPKSLHKIRLAIDIHIFRKGRYLRSTAAHKPLGHFWEQMGGAWGGRFDDGNHYSLEHEGRK